MNMSFQSASRSTTGSGKPTVRHKPHFMTERQMQAYLLARQTLRRVKRLATLVSLDPRREAAFHTLA